MAKPRDRSTLPDLERAPGEASARPSDDAIDVGRLLVELIHVVYATRDVDAAGSPPTHGDEPGPRPPVSAHAIRAAMHLGRSGTRTIGELAEGLGISVGWASRVVSELEASGMVVRTPDRTDRRIVRVSLSAKATAIVERAYLWRAEAIDRALAPLDPAGRAAVRTFLRQAVDELPRARPGRPGTVLEDDPAHRHPRG
jgi:DNA-binding MarR family transcriptional regulator